MWLSPSILLTIAAMERRLRAFWRFSRPHTVIGTTLSLVSLYLVAWATIGGEHRPWLVAATLLAALAANVYIVGLNQITDVEIDRLNKPELPLPAGDFSLRTAVGLVIAALLLALLISLLLGRYLLITVLVSMLIGTIYSLPPFRLKRFHFWAAASIFSVRGIFVNLFIFLHFAAYLGMTPPRVPVHVWGLTLFMVCFSLAIAWFKDVPDMTGDRRFQIATLSLALGPRPVLRLGLALLTFCYVSLALAALAGLLPAVDGPLLAGAHALLLALLWWRARRLNAEEPRAIKRFYLFIWLLFYLEYVIFALACLFE